MIYFVVDHFIHIHTQIRFTIIRRWSLIWFLFNCTENGIFFFHQKLSQSFKKEKKKENLHGCELWPWWDIFQSFRNILINSMNRMTKRVVSFFPTNSPQLINASIIAQWDLGQSWWCRMEWKNVTNKQREWFISVFFGCIAYRTTGKKNEKFILSTWK